MKSQDDVLAEIEKLLRSFNYKDNVIIDLKETLKANEEQLEDLVQIHERLKIGQNISPLWCYGIYVKNKNGDRNFYRICRYIEYDIPYF